MLTFGAATDYALLLVARYREELIRQEDRHLAMRSALGSAAPAIVASALTVALALLTLLLARVGGTQALGPLSASGVVLAMLFSLTVLPATLLIAGRRAFWPRIPRFGADVPDVRASRWGRLGERVLARPRPVWLGGAAVLLVLALGLTQLDLGLAQDEQFAGTPEAIEGQELLDRGGFPAAGPDSVQVVVPDSRRADAVAAELRRLPVVASMGDPERGDPGALLGVRLRTDPFGADALAAVPAIRRNARRAGGPGTLVGGQVAEDRDTREAAERDNLVVVPAITSAGIVLAGTFSILALIPFVALIELGFIIAFGVLLDTLLVRSVIVPALVWDIGPRVFWPSALARGSPQGQA